MKVADKNPIYLVIRDLIAHELKLCAFPAVDKEMPIMDYQVLRRRESSIGWDGPAGAEYG